MPSEQELERLTGQARATQYRARRELVGAGLMRKSRIRSEPRWHLYRSPELCERDARDAQPALAYDRASHSGRAPSETEPPESHSGRDLAGGGCR